jgi:hypothetical protein
MPDTRPPENLVIDPADLSPGDARSAGFDFSPFTLHLISRHDDPVFEPAYQRLWDEFASHDSMEQRGVIISRLKWDPAQPIDRWCFLYRMIAICHAGKPIAVRDCTAMLHRQQPDEVFVHLSHALVDVDFRGGGLAAWLRAFPVQIARRCHRSAGYSGTARVTLLAEMEHHAPGDEMSRKRLTSYGRANFQKIDPAVVDYYQPDFRPPTVIDRAGGPSPLPYMLVARRVGRENDSTILGAEVRHMVNALYSMYSVHFRPQDMAAAWRTLDHYPDDDAVIRLLSPTQ